MSLSERLLNGDPRALARLATYVENDDPIGRAALTRLYRHTGKAHVVGVTGPPGAGKSSLVNQLIAGYRERGQRVGVVAIDPTSPLTGGATLGDRIRMMDRHDDPGVFIRSMASRGQRGGLAPATAGVVHLLDAAGFDLIFIETVGIGQDEVEIAQRAHTTLLVQVPGLGDSIQTIKAGILEVGDILVVNKGDRPGAGDLVRDLLNMLALGENRGARWHVPVLRVQATNGDGIGKLVDRIDAHLAMLREHGGLAERNRAMAESELLMRLRQEIERRLHTPATATEFQRAVNEVANRRLSPAEALDDLLRLSVSTTSPSPVQGRAASDG